MPPFAAPVVVADSITRIVEEDARGAVVVNASHGGVYAAYLAAKLGAAAAIFNDAGVGRDRAGTSGPAHLQEVRMPAATNGHSTAPRPGSATVRGSGATAPAFPASPIYRSSACRRRQSATTPPASAMART